MSRRMSVDATALLVTTLLGCAGALGACGGRALSDEPESVVRTEDGGTLEVGRDGSNTPDSSPLGSDTAVPPPDVTIFDASPPPIDVTVDAVLPPPDASFFDVVFFDVELPDVEILDSGFPDTSTSCVPNTIGEEACGVCGSQSRLCVSNGDGTGSWAAWGFCQGQLPGGCTTGDVQSEPCGLCGSRLKVCQVDCTWGVGECVGEPVNGCAPGSVDFAPGLSCASGGRERLCGDGSTPQGVGACEWGSYGACFVPDGGFTDVALVASGSPGTKVSGTFHLDAATVADRLDPFQACPNATSAAPPTSYQYVEVHNPTASTLDVSVWTSKTAVGPDIDTVIAAYPGTAAPVTSGQRAACSVGVVDTCYDTTDPTACQLDWAALMASDGDTVAIAPFGSVMIYVAAYFTAGDVANTSGDYQLTVRTE